MRSILFSLRRVTLLSRHHQPHAFSPIRNPLIPPINPTSSFPYLIHHASFSSSSSSHPNGDKKVAGPLVEYERRIVAGELLDGDLCQVYSFLHSLSKSILKLVSFFFVSQVGTLRELQRLYDELVQSADACRLDRYSASAKPTRFLFMFPSFFVVLELKCC